MVPMYVKVIDVASPMDAKDADPDTAKVNTKPKIIGRIYTDIGIRRTLDFLLLYLPTCTKPPIT